MMMFYSRNFLLSRCLWWKSLGSDVQTSRHCYASYQSDGLRQFPLDFSTWKTIKSLGLQKHRRGKRGRGLSLLDEKAKPIKSRISRPSSIELNIQNRFTCSASSTTYTFDRQPGVNFANLSIPVRIPFTPQKIQFHRIRLVVAEPAEACQPLTNGWAVNGAIVLVARGGCSFVTKCNIVEQFGAVAVFIADNVNDNAEAMVDMVHDGTAREVHIPAGFLLGTDGYHIREAIKEATIPEAIISIPVNVTTHPDLYTRQPPWSYW